MRHQTGRGSEESIGVLSFSLQIAGALLLGIVILFGMGLADAGEPGGTSHYSWSN